MKIFLTIDFRSTKFFQLYKLTCEVDSKFFDLLYCVIFGMLCVQYDFLMPEGMPFNASRQVYFLPPCVFVRLSRNGENNEKHFKRPTETYFDFFCSLLIAVCDESKVLLCRQL